jgi:hypothetical protein
VPRLSITVGGQPVMEFEGDAEAFKFLPKVEIKINRSAIGKGSSVNITETFDDGGWYDPEDEEPEQPHAADAVPTNRPH